MSKLDLTRPAGALVPVSASDTVEIVPPAGYELPCRGLLVGSGGAAGVVDGTGTLRAAVPLQTGYNPIQARRVNSTSLAASDIWAIF